ncbi:MAG TPA: hypothetical protein DDX54_05735 [Rhodospirillaceae bacterium]|jgi:ribosomal-protein-alanine N-acetyltransferase|nr:GNAT family N-acetyltransferase [Alphaproteobacteria bacterium]HBH26884.1 hypothetical protein [Rhodospirillaceae bacterium]
MLNLGLAEMGVLALAAVLFTRPEDWPRIARGAGRFVRRARYLRYLFSQQFESFLATQDPAVVHNRRMARTVRAEQDVVTTPRLTLRTPTLADAPAIQAQFGRWEIVRWMSTAVPWPYPPDGAETYLRETLLPSVEAGNTVALLLCLEGAVIGMVSFKKDVHADRWEVGFWLGEAHWGQGYMTEALSAACAHFRILYPEAEVYATCDPANRASARAQEKAGFVYQKTLPVADPVHSGATDMELRVWKGVYDGT